ncbi:unnamed protein product [Miscanthus lutarioriparius]|uniref:RING-type domain-containing protein n=1 Tax=Miscanthus lutarioriparius TaxID=422564 RepID=A0A811P2R5_9POAL|nr:unnamed protein product [Miscanthus lutarioriparius]
MGAGAQEDEEETTMVAEGGVREEEQAAEEGAGEEEQLGQGGGGEGEGEGGEEKAAAVMSCSICLDTVVAGSEERSTARLQCGHEFHLDCIGSAFNAKGIMQCPNCRTVENGNWLYANGSRSSQDVNNDEWGYDDLYDHGHSELATFVPLRIQWCPIGRLELPSLFEEVESSAPATFNDFTGQFNTEPMVPVPATPHPGPYLAYFQPALPPASSSSHVAERTTDGAAYNDHWNTMAGLSDGRRPWAYYSQPNNDNGIAEQQGLPLGAMRVGGVDSENQQRGSLSSFYGNGSGRPRIPSVPPMAPQFIRALGNLNDQFHQTSSSLFAGSQQSGGMRPLGAVGPSVPPPENTSFCLFPPATSGPSTMEAEDVRANQFYAWERDRLAPYPLMPVNNEGTWWSSSQQQPPQGAPEPAASASRRLSGQWIGGVGRLPPPENRSPDGSPFRPLHIPRM